MTVIISRKAVTLLPKAHLGGKMVRCGLPHLLHYQEPVHVISDTPKKDQSEDIENEEDAFTCFLDEDMLKQVV